MKRWHWTIEEQWRRSWGGVRSNLKGWPFIVYSVVAYLQFVDHRPLVPAWFWSAEFAVLVHWGVFHYGLKPLLLSGTLPGYYRKDYRNMAYGVLMYVVQHTRLRMTFLLFLLGLQVYLSGWPFAATTYYADWFLEVKGWIGILVVSSIFAYFSFWHIRTHPIVSKNLTEQRIVQGITDIVYRDSTSIEVGHRQEDKGRMPRQ